MSLFQKKEAMQKCRLSCVRTAASLYLSNTTGIVVCCCVVTLVRQETARPRWPRTRNGSIVCQTNVPPTRTRHPGPLFTAPTNHTIKRSNNVTFSLQWERLQDIGCRRERSPLGWDPLGLKPSGLPVTQSLSWLGSP